MSHQHQHGDQAIRFSQEFWDDRYRSADHLWSGQPNQQFVAQVADLPPGEALDAGCGEGADAIWLAERGWTVSAVDLSPVALERALAHALSKGSEVAGRIAWQHRDLRSWDPDSQRFDLVSAQFLHLPAPELDSLIRGLAAAVRPGGILLLVSHHADDLHVNVGRPDEPQLFPTVDQLVAALVPGEWDILVAAPIGRPATGLDGEPVTVTDSVLRAQRR